MRQFHGNLKDCYDIDQLLVGVHCYQQRTVTILLFLRLFILRRIRLLSMRNRVSKLFRSIGMFDRVL